jgi:endonuclease YncB( thermonuclease family)
MGWGRAWFACGWLVLGALGCDPPATAETGPNAKAPSAEERPAATPPKRSEVDTEGLLIGEFRLASDPVIDGDTIRVEGIEGSVRLLGIDTEERFHGKGERAAAEKDFAAYLKRRRGNSARPTKTGTPMGEEAKTFAEEFFAGADTVRLERDDPKALRGGFGRVLAYAFVKKDGRWTSYNIESVRAGMSPYFTKYGYSHRFHNQFSRAEAEARRANRGIWNPDAQGYGDYEERTAWWNARADFFRAFEQEANARDEYIDLSDWDALEELESHVGEEAVVLSTVSDIKRFKRLTRVSLSMGGERAFPLIFFDRGVFEESGIGAFRREPIVARGKVERYKKGNYETLQIVIERPEQLLLPTLPSTD